MVIRCQNETFVPGMNNFLGHISLRFYIQQIKSIADIYISAL